MVCLLLFVCQAHAAPDRYAFLKAFRKGAPSWMEAQISRDLSPFQAGIPTSLVDNTLAIFNPQIYLLVRYKVVDGHLSCSHNLDSSSPVIQERVNAYLQALNYLNDTLGLPNLDFVVTMHDHWGPPISNQTPLFAYGRDDRSTKPILIPDFIALEGYKPKELGGYKVSDEVWQQTPWDSKIKKAFWRGSTTGGYFTKQNWSTFPRTQLALFSLKRPDLLDAKITFVCQAEAGVEQIIASQKLMGNFTPIADQLRYRYLIDVDGNGWTVPRCFWILLSNSLLLKQDSDWICWYTAGLVPYRHFVPVSSSSDDIFAKIEWAKGHDAEARQMAQNGTEFALNDLSLENTYLYLYRVLIEYSKLQN